VQQHANESPAKSLRNESSQTFFVSPDFDGSTQGASERVPAQPYASGGPSSGVTGQSTKKRAGVFIRPSTVHKGKPGCMVGA